VGLREPLYISLYFYILVYMKIYMELEDGVARAVDEARGDMPRARWIRQAIMAKLAAPSILESKMSAPRGTSQPKVEPLRGGPVAQDAPPPKAASVPPTDEYKRMRAAVPTLRPVTSKRHHLTCVCMQCKPQ
jgi:hypothetical protein